MPKIDVNQILQKSVNEILDSPILDLFSLDFEDLQKVVKKVATVANTRAGKLRAAGITSPALKTFERAGGTLSPKSAKTSTTLLNQISRARTFINAKTSTVRSAREYNEKISAYIGETKEPTTEDMNKFWNAYNRVVERFKGALTSGIIDSDTLLQNIRDEINDIDIHDISLDDLTERMMKVAEEYYEEYAPKTDDIFIDSSPDIFPERY